MLLSPTCDLLSLERDINLVFRVCISPSEDEFEAVAAHCSTSLFLETLTFIETGSSFLFFFHLLTLVSELSEDEAALPPTALAGPPSLK